MPGQTQKTSLFEVVEKSYRNHSVIRLVLESPTPLPDPPAPYHVYIYNEDGAYRPYSPLAKRSSCIELAIKVYEHGALSQYLSHRNVGDRVTVSDFLLVPDFAGTRKRNILALAGGTGITPIYQTMSAILRGPGGPSAGDGNGRDVLCSLLFFNSTAQDAFLEEELIRLSEEDGPGRLQVEMVATNESGQAATEIVRNKVATAIQNGSFDYVLVCGPPGFMDTVSGPKTVDLRQGEVTGVLKELGYASDRVWKF